MCWSYPEDILVISVMLMLSKTGSASSHCRSKHDSRQVLGNDACMIHKWSARACCMLNSAKLCKVAGFCLFFFFFVDGIDKIGILRETRLYTSLAPTFAILFVWRCPVLMSAVLFTRWHCIQKSTVTSSRPWQKAMRFSSLSSPRWIRWESQWTVEKSLRSSLWQVWYWQRVLWSVFTQMTKKIKKLEKETAHWRTRWENSNKALVNMAEEVMLCGKDFLFIF